MGNEIEHHGVKGMKWGVRKKARSSGGNKTTNRKKKSFNKRLNKNKNNKVSTLKKVEPNALGLKFQRFLRVVV